MGELRATHAELERSGETLAELAAKWQEYLARIQREAQQRVQEEARQHPEQRGQDVFQ
jgi:prefoldin subunit 5